MLKLTANNVVQLENVYDKKGQLNTLKDKVTGKNYRFERDELDNVTAVYEVDGSDVQISSGYGESVVYDALGSVKKKTIVGLVSQVYDYTYKTNSLHTLEENGTEIVKAVIGLFTPMKSMSSCKRTKPFSNTIMETGGLLTMTSYFRTCKRCRKKRASNGKSI